jgi:hypothetical protein
LRTFALRIIRPPTGILFVVLALLSSAAHGGIVLRQDFQSSDTVDDYEHLTSPNLGQFNDIGQDANGGTWEITDHGLRLTRTGAGGEDNGAGLTRSTDFSGPPSVLHVTFDLGVLANDFQNDAMVLEIGDVKEVTDYEGGLPNVATFDRLFVDLTGSHRFEFDIGGTRTTGNFPADGRLFTVSYFLNGSGASRTYLAPDGSTRGLGHNRVALWVGTTPLFDNVPRAYTGSALSGLRLRFAAADLAVWRFDNIVISNELPAPGTRSVTRFTLINADTDQPIPKFDPLTEGTAVDFEDQALNHTRNLNVRAHTYPFTVGSVRFRLDGTSNFRTENDAPYALAGDSNGNYNAWTPTIGMHTLTATPFSGSSASGTAGTPLTVNFLVGIDSRRSLAVTDEVILEGRFSFQRLMDHLVSQANVPGLTSLQLFRQWWDTQNPAPGEGFNVRHCDEDAGTLNGFPYDCRPANRDGGVPGEGIQARVNPFTGNENTNPDFYKPIGLFNRFDLAPTDGSHCGEYRLIYARAGSPTDLHPPPLNVPRRNLVIFEAVLPNPQPGLGIAGCRPVAEFWANLSRLDVTTRATELERFYFAGLPGFAPAAHVTHFGARSDSAGKQLGQVRTNQFLQSPWMLREFQLRHSCQSGTCALEMLPTTDKPNPFGPLFGPNDGGDAGPPHPLTGAFQSSFPSHVGSLSRNNVNTIGLCTEPRFDSGQSPNALNMATEPFENNYAFHFRAAPDSFKAAIQAQLPPDGGVTAEHIVLRAQALSCAGCHQLNNEADIGGGLIWPSSNGFVQVSELESDKETGPNGERYNISPALETAFLPHRKKVLENFLNGLPSTAQGCGTPATASSPKAGKKPAPGPVPTLGGSTTH